MAIHYIYKDCICEFTTKITQNKLKFFFQNIWNLSKTLKLKFCLINGIKIHYIKEPRQSVSIWHKIKSRISAPNLLRIQANFLGAGEYYLTRFFCASTTKKSRRRWKIWESDQFFILVRDPLKIFDDNVCSAGAPLEHGQHRVSEIFKKILDKTHLTSVVKVEFQQK